MRRLIDLRWAVAMLVAAVSGAAVAPDGAPTTAAPSSQPVALSDGPISYFQDRCARCHGPYGSGYLPDSQLRLDDVALRNIIRDMAAGPAMAPIEGPDLDAQVGFHRSLLDARPFLAIVKRDAGSLEGEVSPGSRVVLKAGDQTIEAKVTDHTWSVALGSLKPEQLRGATLIGTRGERRTDLPAAESFSHAAR